MMKWENLSNVVFLALLWINLDVSNCFQLVVQSPTTRCSTIQGVAARETKDDSPKKDNKAMAFLRKIGRVGGSANQFTTSMGVDEGPAGKTTSGGTKVSRVKKCCTVC